MYENETIIKCAQNKRSMESKENVGNEVFLQVVEKEKNDTKEKVKFECKIKSPGIIVLWMGKNDHQ